MNEILKTIAEKYANESTSDERFVPTHGRGNFYSGKIEYAENVVSRNAHFTVTLSAGIKVGGNVPAAIHNAIRREVEAACEGVAHYNSIDGTAWSMYGYTRLK